jgi:hypothetical protein
MTDFTYSSPSAFPRHEGSNKRVKTVHNEGFYDLNIRNKEDELNAVFGTYRGQLKCIKIIAATKHERRRLVLETWA